VIFMSKKTDWATVAMGCGLIAAGLLFLPDELVVAPLGVAVIASGLGVV